MEALDIHRQRWTKKRDELGLVNSDSKEFGLSGLARRVADPGVRLLILPPDPGASILDFDAPFWEWWTQERENPFEGAPRTRWGTQTTPTLDAAATFDAGGDSKWERWASFIALHRSSALETVWGRSGASTWTSKDGKEQRAFWLTEIVGRLWVALDLYAEVIERLSSIGPWEVSVALIGTNEAQLGNVATGWKEIDGWWPGESPRCPETNVLIRHEVSSWPDADGRQRLAFRIGAQIEDTWGVTDRRFLVHPKHEGAGAFDPSRYRGSR